MDEPLHFLDRLGNPFLFLEERHVTIAKNDSREVKNKFPKLVFVLEGTLLHQFNGRELEELHPGSIIINLGDYNHRYVGIKSRSISQLRVMRLTIKPEALKPGRYRNSADPMHSLLARLPRVGVYHNVTRIAPWLHEASKDLRSSHHDARSRVRALSELMLIDCWREIKNQNSKDQGPRHGKATDLSEQISTYLENHFMKKIMLSDIARHVGRSEEHLSRVFRQDRGRTIHTELQHLRIERAKYLLLCTDRTITHIAEMCGYSAVAHFSRIFHHTCRQTPSEFRKKGLSRPPH